MSEHCFDNVLAKFLKSDSMQVESRILVMFFMTNAQGSLSLNIERAEKLCNDLGLAIAEYKLAEKEEDAKRNENKYFEPSSEQVDEFRARNANQS